MGAGECIALIELGGGFVPADLTAYFKQLKLNQQPTVSAVSIGNGSNAPTGDPNGPDGEVMLDIEDRRVDRTGSEDRRLLCGKYRRRLPQRHHHRSP